MNWFHLKLCLMVVVIFTESFVAATDNDKANLKVEELGPLERIKNTNDVVTKTKSVTSKSPEKKVNRNNGHNMGFHLGHGFVQIPPIGQPLDAQASSPYNKVVLVLDNDKNKLADLMKPAEESFKRLTRESENMAQQQIPVQVLSQMFNAMLALVTQTTQANGLDSMNGPINEIVGAARTIFDPRGASAGNSDAKEVKTETEGEAADETVGAPEPDLETVGDSADTPEPSKTSSNSGDSILGSPMLPLSFVPFNLPLGVPMNMLTYMPSSSAFNNFPLYQMGATQISEVRVKPDQPYSPFKIAPKDVDQKIMSEERLKAALREGLIKKTIPILWFHTPNNKNDLQKSTEELEMEAKLEIFERQVVSELKQLQEFSRMANEMKEAELKSGAEPTESLTTKLNLSEIPIYEITLGDIDKTFKDKHFKLLMQSISHHKSKEFHRHHQATTRYLTDLTGAPIKRQTNAEDSLKNMEKDDVLKMMTYAYRMAAMNGHDMPWLKNNGMDGTATDKNMKSNHQMQSTDENTEMNGERQWLEDKQRQMAMEAEKQKQMAEEKNMKSIQNNAPQNNPEQNQFARQWANHNMQHVQGEMQHQMNLQRQMVPGQMEQQMPMQRQMFDPNMQLHQQEMQQHAMPNFNIQPQMPMQRQWLDGNMQQRQEQKQQPQPPMIQRQMTDPLMQQQQQRQWVDPNMSQLPNQRQWADANIPETMTPLVSKPEQQHEQRQWADPNTAHTSFGSTNNDQRTEQKQMTEPKMNEQPSGFRTSEQRQMTIATPEQKEFEQRKWAEPKMTDPTTDTLKKNDQQLEQRQWIDTKVSEQPAAKNQNPMMPQRNWADTNTQLDVNIPPVVGDARFKDLFDELDVFDHGKHKGKGAPKPTIVNYYYNAGGSRYPPIYGYAPPVQSYARPPPPMPTYSAPSYGPPPPRYKQNAYYGGAAYNGYRAAVGDDEIAVMLQQHQTMPKMMTLNDATTTPIANIVNTGATTATEFYMANTGINKNHSKRLAKNNDRDPYSPAAYVIVIRNQTSKLDKSRRKRSTEYATLEPIDENSLNALRKTYKNSLKEITLNPNETPAEALMRYNAETIREALAKANQQPMEITATAEHDEEVKDEKFNNEVERHNQQQYPQQLPQDYSMPNNDQTTNQRYISVPVSIQQTRPLSVPYAQQGPVYDASLNQDGTYSNYISKFNNPITFSSPNKAVPQNPFMTMYNSLESVPYIDNYSDASKQYQMAANHNNFHKMSEPVVYQKSHLQPQLNYNHLTSNDVNKNYQPIYTSGKHIMDYDKSKLSQYGSYVSKFTTPKTQYTFSNAINKNSFKGYSSAVQPQLVMTNRLKGMGSPNKDSFSIGNLMSVIKERISQCCNECKDKVLQGLEETFTQKPYGGDNKQSVMQLNMKSYTDKFHKPHTLTYRKSDKEDDLEYKQWLTDMSGKGYDKVFLSKDHQKEYLKDGRLNLHLADEDDYHDHEDMKVFYKNNQFYKRETTLPEPDAESEAEIVTAPIAVDNDITKLDAREREEEHEEGEEEEEEEVDEAETEDDVKKGTVNQAREKKSNVNVEKESDINYKKVMHDLKTKKIINKNEKLENSNSSRTMETAESTTHSVYALRGQFKPQKFKPISYLPKEGKQFETYKTINKLGNANHITKPESKKNDIEKGDKLEEILDILHDLTKTNKEKLIDNSKEDNLKATTIASSLSQPYSITSTETITSTTAKPLTTQSTTNGNNVSKAVTSDNDFLAVDKTKKIRRRRTRVSSKSKKLVDISSGNNVTETD